MIATAFFSIIMPVYNRADLVGRALQSCLAQSFHDFEVIVLDDGSSDGSADVVRSFSDPRIRLIVHERNRGRCPARNTAMAAARGEWLVMLDSDDELTPGALDTIHGHAVSAPDDVTILRYMCRDDRGLTSPHPPYSRQTWTYEQYLRSLEESFHGRSESLPCSRARLFPAIRFPEGHAEEALYHFDLARAGLVATFPDIVRIYHQDAPNQITRPGFRRALQFAGDAARNVDELLARHGQRLRRHAPTVYALRLREGALHHFMNGDRRKGLHYARAYVRERGLSPKLVLIVLLGLMGGPPLAWSQTMQGTLRRAFR